MDFFETQCICIVHISYGNVSVWVAGWLAGGLSQPVYCIKTTKPILDLFRPSGIPIIEAFGTPYADTKKENRFIGAV